MNAPNRYELYVLEDGEKSVEVTEDTKIPNAATIKIVKQDHTLANLLRSQLLTMPNVLFAGYKVPHPLHPYFLLKIQTDGTITPAAVLEKACTDLIGMVATLESKFKREFTLNNVQDGVPEDAYGVPMSTGQWEGGGTYVDI
ncbi:DNA-directed RNA polymerase II [Fomes fomentarius]|nr:DNA-directed RNA polymerase II [Fomes fomentarius]